MRHEPEFSSHPASSLVTLLKVTIYRVVKPCVLVCRYQITRCHIAEDCDVYVHHYENLKYYSYCIDWATQFSHVVYTEKCAMHVFHIYWSDRSPVMWVLSPGPVCVRVPSNGEQDSHIYRGAVWGLSGQCHSHQHPSTWLQAFIIKKSHKAALWPLWVIPNTYKLLHECRFSYQWRFRLWFSGLWDHAVGYVVCGINLLWPSEYKWRYKEYVLLPCCCHKVMTQKNTKVSWNIVVIDIHFLNLLEVV